MRIAGGLAIAALAVTTACTTSTPAAQAAKAPTSPVASERPVETVTPLLQQALPNAKGKTFTSIVVDFPPNARAVPHRHGQSFVYAYVLDGSVRSKLGDKPAGTYKQGQFFVEPPGAHHVLTENTSRTEPAKLLVVFVSDTGDELKIDDPKS
ncbi:cupin [Streptomyces sp. AS58]|uniref:cupin domain-containing protein n=1 Tax=Streptomyces sp. AS58 TaxID=1519489 RepID=UPI0006AF47F8|nr:cupin domain-containing protein [Streptomyces sp. AS58]KOV71663.1 cupin [Streptomyces sp. AS58]